MKYKYFYMTSKPISKKQWNDFEKRWGCVNDEIRDGRTLVAYRREVPRTERDIVYLTGKF